MQTIDVRVVDLGDPPPFPELQDRKIIDLTLDKVAILQEGMQSGRASMTLLVNLPDQSVGLIELSVKQFNMIAAIVRGATERWNEDEG